MRRRLPGWLLPAVILAGFMLLFAGVFRECLLPAPLVLTAPVLVTERDASDPDATAAPTGWSEQVLFQAAGWIEPDPYAVKASVLVNGVVATVEVLEGEDVEKGELLATLVDEDARLSLSMAEARQQMLVSSRMAHLAAIDAMTSRLDAFRAEVLASEAGRAEADDNLSRLDRLSSASVVSDSDITAARLRLQKENFLHQAARARAEEIAAEIERMKLQTFVMEKEISMANVEVEQARLAMERTRVYAPISGRVLRLTAAPGDKKMLDMDHPESSTICLLYDPQRVQARVDVPLADAGELRVGQRARIHTNLLGETVFAGEVTRIAGEADLQRNTLQAKVRILDPDDRLRPEMLCRVEFFGEGIAPGEGDSAGGSLALWLPSAALYGDKVWVCDANTRRLSSRTVKVADEERDGHVRVIDGVLAGELVVIEPGDWRDGQRIQPKQPTDLKP